MKQKRIYKFGFVAIIIGSLLFVSFCRNKHIIIKINYEYVGSIKLISEPYNENYSLFSNSKSLEKVFKDDFKYNINKDTLLMSLDFNKYDYIASYEKKITNVEYNSEYAKKHDFCDYIKEKPLKVTYSNIAYKNMIFIYKIFDKNKYRHLCP